MQDKIYFGLIVFVGFLIATVLLATLGLHPVKIEADHYTSIEQLFTDKLALMGATLSIIGGIFLGAGKDFFAYDHPFVDLNVPPILIGLAAGIITYVTASIFYSSSNMVPALAGAAAVIVLMVTSALFSGVAMKRVCTYYEEQYCSEDESDQIDDQHIAI